jgi:hypothetical protein
MSPSAQPGTLSPSSASSRRWIRYFRRNAGALLAIPWGAGPALTAAERAAVLPSLREFQRGESLEGGHFFRVAREHAERSGDADYVEAHRLFMAEERRHGSDLGRFLRQEGVAPLEHCTASSWLFRWCGSRAGLEQILLVVLCAEVLAQVYYRAVLAATGSPALRRLCVQLLCDEAHHVRFHCERLALMRGPSAHRWLTRTVDALLFFGAFAVVWWGHARALRAGGYGLRRFWRAARGKYRRARSLMRVSEPEAPPPVRRRIVADASGSDRSAHAAVC